MRKSWTWELRFTLDVEAGEAHRATTSFDGRRYEVNIAPAERLTELRKGGRARVGRTDEINPGRGGRCPCCGS